MAGFIGFFFTCNKHSPHLLALSVVPPPSQLDIGQLLQLATIQTEALVSGCTLHNIHKRKNCISECLNLLVKLNILFIPKTEDIK